MTSSEILLYQTEDGQTRIDVWMENETVWLSQKQMVELFQTTKQNISLHIRNIFSEGELDENAVVKDYLTTAADGKRYSIKIYNLDVIISVGYRVKSHRGTQFRISAKLAKELAEAEYEKFRQSRIEAEDAQEMKELEDGIKNYLESGDSSQTK